MGGAGPGRAKHVKYLERAGGRGGRGYPVGGGGGEGSAFGKLTVQAKPHAIRVRSRI
jgi:hypothetical protein